jgi:predicted  nucleic acid-binding Zn-ribbon protein
MLKWEGSIDDLNHLMNTLRGVKDSIDS